MPEHSLASTVGHGRIPAVDVMKLLACFGVVCIHTTPFETILPVLSRSILYPSRLAVPFFFIVSGYFFQDRLLASVREMSGMGTYTLRLGSRYYGFFLLWSALYLLKPSFGEVHRLGLVSGYVAGVAPKLRAIVEEPVTFLIEGCGGHLWFLQALTVSLVALWLSERYRLRALWLAVAVALYVVSVLDGAYAATPIGLSVPLNTRNGLFIGGLGVALGAWLRRADLRQRGVVGLCAAVAVAGLYSMEVVWSRCAWGVDAAQGTVLMTLPLACALYIAGLSCSCLTTSRFIETGGRAVYGIYLCHVFMIYPVNTVLSRIGPCARDMLAAPAVFILAGAVVLGVKYVPVLRRVFP
jgi:peptidoglycan/LPS O-acetylase OafA/YrhL